MILRSSRLPTVGGITFEGYLVFALVWLHQCNCQTMTTIMKTIMNHREYLPANSSIHFVYAAPTCCSMACTMNTLNSALYSKQRTQTVWKLLTRPAWTPSSLHHVIVLPLPLFLPVLLWPSLLLPVEELEQERWQKNRNMLSRLTLIMRERLILNEPGRRKS